jgi:hypothetical protein
VTSKFILVIAETWLFIPGRTCSHWSGNHAKFFCLIFRCFWL